MTGHTASKTRCLNIRFQALLTLLAVLSAGPVMAEARIAVASNFRTAAEVLLEKYQATGGQKVSLAVGSSGKHFAQIMNGAPFDALLSADSDRPLRLEAAGRAVSGSRFTYAVGQLVLWSPDPNRVDKLGSVLSSSGFRKLAIANPRLAPYGLAAQQTLESLGLYERLEHRLVQGENISQAFQFVISGNAELGLVAASQTINLPGGSRWNVPGHLHDPIEQQAVRLSDARGAADFLAFLASPGGRLIIREQGYGLPDDERR